MKTLFFPLAVLVVALGTIGSASALDDKKDKKNPLPGDAAWDLKALKSAFRIVKTDYDDRTKEVKWTVETREGIRTADFVREISRKPFTFRFLDGDMKEVATVELGKSDFRGIPKARVMKENTRLTITLEVPRTIGKAKQVIVVRGRP
jgi:hypothetical protein